ncbi:hypothetical protein MPTK1_2g23660 [Marchantia polymorpha subsp. ruderalis]|uniref:Uncharacterized protein n=1 Tax=Marchantia polymorpha TaxID=3197 RepID=A0A2R6WP81_MARPO|nr:hypothetical protein MARPO_0069s0015 [Marchantia polymorpha]BBN03462.1 hypothetical protein Mp_2g23660 [Marchantia polymorpha subsp. ruderalis]|eukprot:PTQ35667.1 hypothetical protein MARPO_0069s0015 [Marchantia polymorpha]
MRRVDRVESLPRLTSSTWLDEIAHRNITELLKVPIARGAAELRKHFLGKEEFRICRPQVTGRFVKSCRDARSSLRHHRSSETQALD